MDLAYWVLVNEKKISRDLEIKIVCLDMGTIEAEAAMFGQAIPIRLSSIIIGCRLVGQPHFMSTSIDLISALMKVG